MIRTKGEAGTGNIVEAVWHARAKGLRRPATRSPQDGWPLLGRTSALCGSSFSHWLSPWSKTM
jgi:hypothetical protein